MNHKRSKIILACLLFTFSWRSFCFAEQESVQIHGDSSYEKPHLFDCLTKTPGDLKKFGKTTFRKKNIAIISLVVVGTGLLMLMDQRLVDRSKQLGHHLGISQTNYQKTITSIPMGKSKFEIEGPFDSGSALYYIGDGWVEVLLAGGLVTYGLSKSDNRALQTASQIAEAVLAAGIVAQGFKHVTGRASPFTNKSSGDTWRFFPNQKRYAAHVSTYDAFPSGHLTASMATLTVLAENYPEHTWIRPVGYSLFGLLGFQMMNNGVHWASDYPLSLALGYSFGKIAAKGGRKKIGQESSLKIYPMVLPGGGGIQTMYRFGRNQERQRKT